MSDDADDQVRAEALKRSIACRMLALDLYNTQLLDVALTRIELSTDRVREGLAELRSARVQHAQAERAPELEAQS